MADMVSRLAVTKRGGTVVTVMFLWRGALIAEKWEGLYPACLALSGGIIGWGHSVFRPLLSQPPVFMLQYFMCSGARVSLLYLEYSPALSSVLCEFKYALSNSLALSLFLSLSRRT
jgi:hypothetical protein